MDEDDVHAAAAASQYRRSILIEHGVVRRPAYPWTSTVHDFLRYLRRGGLDCVPEPLGISGGIEALRFIEGESGADGWYHQHAEAGLRSAARMLGRIHDASTGWVPPASAVWGSPPIPGDDSVCCHGDPGPWNFVWQGEAAVGLIDWDFLHPGPRVDDVAYALKWFAPFRDDANALEWHHFPEVPDRRARVETFLDAYGPLPEFDIAEAIATRAEATMEHERSLAEQGIEPQRTWVAEGSLEAQALEVRWIRQHRHLLA